MNYESMFRQPNLSIERQTARRFTSTDCWELHEILGEQQRDAVDAQWNPKPSDCTDKRCKTNDFFRLTSIADDCKEHDDQIDHASNCRL